MTFDASDVELLRVLSASLKAGNEEVTRSIMAELKPKLPLDPYTAARVLIAAHRSLACTDPYVVEAHALLAIVEPKGTPPLSSIRVRPLREGLYASCERGAITISPTSPMYRSASLDGNMWGLAMLLHHEHFHAKHGGDEDRAYAATIRFLETHHPDRELLAIVHECASATTASALAFDDHSSSRRDHMPFPYLHENGKLCCSNEASPCPDCKEKMMKERAVFDMLKEISARDQVRLTRSASGLDAPPDPYASDIAKRRAEDARQERVSLIPVRDSHHHVTYDPSGAPPDPWAADAERLRRTNR